MLVSGLNYLVSLVPNLWYEGLKRKYMYAFVYTANASKLIEKNFLDLRNMFSNQKNIGIFFSKQEE